MKTLTPYKLREILKKLKKNKYYEHVPHIINRLNGEPPPTISRETEEELRRMFKEIQIPFHKFCPKSRKNFLSYSYVLHKFVQLLELDDCVEKIIITNIPGFFKICYNLIKMFIHKDTRKKIFFEKKTKSGDSTNVSFSNNLEELELGV